jgi:peptidoglycan/xylan/chitin deacetylase (PgdA/CDA1 family)
MAKLMKVCVVLAVLMMTQLGSAPSLSLQAVTSIPAPTEKVIIFRNDDAQIWWRINTFEFITNTLIDNKIPQTIGVIPSINNFTIRSDPDFRNYLNSIKDYTTVELALHGYQHTTNEFASLSQTKAEEKITKGLDIFRSDLGIIPTTFIPPNHAYNDETLSALKNLRFTRFSGGLYNDPSAWQYKPTGILHVPSVTEFYDWDANRQRTTDEITSECQGSLDRYNTCVILFHSWQFTDDETVIVNPNTYKTLLNVIDWTHKKEAEGVKLMTLSQFSK